MFIVYFIMNLFMNVLCFVFEFSSMNLDTIFIIMCFGFRVI